MEKEYNCQYFETIEGALSFVKTLLSAGNKDSDFKKEHGYYNDIHMYQEESLFFVEWMQKSYEYDGSGSFVFCSENQKLLTEYIFPDNHYEFLETQAEYEEVLEDWLKENPGYYKNSYGVWEYNPNKEGNE